jgi:formamidase
MARAHSIEVDFGRPLAEQPDRGHNRWHPGIAPVLRVDAGDSVVIQTIDALDVQLPPGSTAADVAAASFFRVHPMTGPIYVEGAEAGDQLAVRIDDIEPAPFAITAIIPGSGFLRDLFGEPFLAHWTIADGYAVSEQLPGIRIPDQSFPGVIGVAPSPALLTTFAEREQELAGRGGAVILPDPTSAVPASGPAAVEGLRTIPPRENGGNVDIKQLTRGTTVLLPVFVDGALFSIGDAHFAQGDGEVCGTAIEMAGTFHVTFTVHKGRASSHGVSYLRDGPQRTISDRYFATTGICVDSHGRNESENATLAARNAILAMIDHLTDERGYTREQAYAICSVAVNVRLSQLVDVPNFLASAILPLDLFAE